MFILNSIVLKSSILVFYFNLLLDEHNQFKCFILHLL